MLDGYDSVHAEDNDPRNRMPMTEMRRLATSLAGYLVTPAAPLILRTNRSLARRVDAMRFMRMRDWPIRRVDNVLDGYYVSNPTLKERVEGRQYSDPPFDSEGIPLINYGYRRWAGMPDRPQYNATTISQWALFNFDQWVDHRTSQHRDTFLRMADWLREHQRSDGAWPNDFPLPQYDRAPGWISAMYQGQAMSVLIRAHALTDASRYLEAAELAGQPLLRSWEEGGALSRDESGTWLEEVPEEEPSHILNGMIFAMYGLRDHHLMTGAEWSRSLFDECVETLASNIHRYERDGVVFYEIKRETPVNDSHYMLLQIQQVRTLYDITGRTSFRDAADTWAALYQPPTKLPLGRLMLRAWAEERHER
jgi:hypothetical protein